MLTSNMSMCVCFLFDRIIFSFIVYRQYFEQEVQQVRQEVQQVRQERQGRQVRQVRTVRQVTQVIHGRQEGSVFQNF
jgi:hypothetical protein